MLNSILIKHIYFLLRVPFDQGVTNDHLSRLPEQRFILNYDGQWPDAQGIYNYISYRRQEFRTSGSSGYIPYLYGFLVRLKDDDEVYGVLQWLVAIYKGFDPEKLGKGEAFSDAGSLYIAGKHPYESLEFAYGRVNAPTSLYYTAKDIYNELLKARWIPISDLL